MTRGTYALLVHVPYGISLSVGELGRVDFKSGYYAYVGSALGGLEGRVNRHMSEKKKTHWHIDHLLIHARSIDAIVAQSEERKECDVAKEMTKELPSVRGFGASGCKCDSHLFYSPDQNELIRRVVGAFKKCGLKPEKGVRYG